MCMRQWTVLWESGCLSAVEKKQSFARKPLKPDRFPEMLGNNGVQQEICAAPSNRCSVLGTGTLRRGAALHPMENACAPFPRCQCVVCDLIHLRRCFAVPLRDGVEMRRQS